ncbi:cytochrome P450 3A5-like [Paramacrobiotus metropolitanus]|uniref:cytochrome P450 3A5-like n=1 Tax=Paramacrobiotus metropolitanus TaxID=2943436 RepID=UPI002445B4C2|nr:cytochrome P450 3A5-like [Paramacrobiotus metropolitanus]
MAGYETTASTLAFLTHSLAVHPGIQERLRQEILEVVGDSDTVTYDHLSQMEYLDCCVNETLRMYPPAVRTERQCNTTWTYNGVTVEKGDIVAIPIYAIHHDPAYWPDPEQFNPDSGIIEHFDYLGFAYFDIKVMMASTLPKFRFERSSRTEEPLTFETIGLLRAKNGLWVNVEKL